jgi:hypothetical protein
MRHSVTCWATWFEKFHKRFTKKLRVDRVRQSAVKQQIKVACRFKTAKTTDQNERSIPAFREPTSELLCGHDFNIILRCAANILVQESYDTCMFRARQRLARIIYLNNDIWLSSEHQFQVRIVSYVQSGRIYANDDIMSKVCDWAKE